MHRWPLWVAPLGPAAPVALHPPGVRMKAISGPWSCARRIQTTMAGPCSTASCVLLCCCRCCRRPHTSVLCHFLALPYLTPAMRRHNGLELGDPDCVWWKGEVPDRTEVCVMVLFDQYPSPRCPPSVCAHRPLRTSPTRASMRLMLALQVHSCLSLWSSRQAAMCMLWSVQ